MGKTEKTRDTELLNSVVNSIIHNKTLTSSDYKKLENLAEEFLRGLLNKRGTKLQKNDFLEVSYNTAKNFFWHCHNNVEKTADLANIAGYFYTICRHELDHILTQSQNHEYTSFRRIFRETMQKLEIEEKLHSSNSRIALNKELLKVSHSLEEDRLLQLILSFDVPLLLNESRWTVIRKQALEEIILNVLYNLEGNIGREELLAGIAKKMGITKFDDYSFDNLREEFDNEPTPGENSDIPWKDIDTSGFDNACKAAVDEAENISLSASEGIYKLKMWSGYYLKHRTLVELADEFQLSGPSSSEYVVKCPDMRKFEKKLRNIILEETTNRDEAILLFKRICQELEAYIDSLPEGKEEA